MIKATYPLYLANEAREPKPSLEVTNKYSGDSLCRVPLADAGLIDEGIRAAVEASQPFRRWAPYERQAVLRHCVNRFQEREAELAEILSLEAGKPIRDSRGEVTRFIETFQIAADEAVRPLGETLNLEISARAKGYRGITQRVPVGPCSFITPFNFPLNLVAHKVAPALAVGCPFVLKPDSRTPIGALILGEILAETDLPEGTFSILPCEVSEADALTVDERFKLLSFTGSPKVGWELKARAGKKRVVLELGGNAACILDAGSDLEDAVGRLITGAFYQSGQSCISVQRILAHESLAGELETRLVAAARELRTGDPMDEEVFLGPLIDERTAERLESWVQSAVEAGAELLCGGQRRGALMDATLLKQVPANHPLSCEEAFGPVAILETFSSFGEAIELANRSDYGIHTGVFTPRIDHALEAWDGLETGGVLINEVPSWRVDNMPYGGGKASGLGREGIRYAMEDMTEIRSLVIREPQGGS